MPLTRRGLLTACGAVGGTLLLPGTAAASADDWPTWLRDNRRHVAAVVDDGRGGRVAHRPHVPQPLASVAQLTHLDAYTRAVAAGRLDPAERVRVGEWQRHRAAGDRPTLAASLRHLGISATDGATADTPRATVTLDDLAAVMTRCDDNAAADLLRTRLDGQLPSFLGERLRLVLGRPESPERYLTDPRLELEVLGRRADAPTSYDDLRAWARGTWPGTASALHHLLRALPPTPHLDRSPGLPGIATIGTKTGSLPGVVTVAARARWEDGRVGTAVVLTREVPESRFTDADGLAELVRTALLDPAALREFQVGVT